MDHQLSYCDADEADDDDDDDAGADDDDAGGDDDDAGGDTTAADTAAADDDASTYTYDMMVPMIRLEICCLTNQSITGHNIEYL